MRELNFHYGTGAPQGLKNVTKSRTVICDYFCVRQHLLEVNQRLLGIAIGHLHVVDQHLEGRYLDRLFSFAIDRHLSFIEDVL